MLEAKTDKRRTFIGTLHWMPPELWETKPEYSDEVSLRPDLNLKMSDIGFGLDVNTLRLTPPQVDVWAFGCTIYECAVGRPPNADLREPRQLGARMRRQKTSIELPETEEYPQGLRSLVSQTLSPDPINRPSMSDVLEHPYVADTEDSHTTDSLKELVNAYYTWIVSGGQRTSLFIPGGAFVSDAPGSLPASDDEWNFSTTADYDKRISTILNIDIPQVVEPFDPRSPEGEKTPKVSQSEELTAAQKANFEERVRRGATDLTNLFDQDKPSYEYKTKTDFRPITERRVSDLPFRAMAEDRPPSIASNEIDLGDFDSSNYATIAPTKLADAPTIRAKRGEPNRGGSSTNVTPLKSGLATDEDYLTTQHITDRPATQDFSFPPKEWKHDEEQRPATAMGTTADVHTRKDTRKTMDWSFDMAMSDVEPESEDIEPEVSDTKTAKKHDTMQWSFSQAMAETGATIATIQTPARPAPVLRTMTMPVTSSEIDTTEAELPRPSTATSEAMSETSFAGSEADPFGLDSGAPGYPVPRDLDQRGMSEYYHTEGTTLTSEMTLPYNNTVAGPAPFMMGPPARIGDEGFPGPSGTTITPVPVADAPRSRKRRGFRKQKKKSSSENEETTTSPDSPASPESSVAASFVGGRQTVTLPKINPPNAAALDVRASNEELEREFGSMLGNFGEVLKGAGKAMGLGRRRRGSRRSSSEWESEE